MSNLTSIPTDRTHKQFWTEFFQLYKENPCLWDQTNPNFLKKNLKALALNVLLEKYWEINSLATTETVRKRLVTFRAGFVKEHKRESEAILNGALFTSRLWYYNYLTFLKNNGEDTEKLQEWDKSECTDNVIELTHGTVVFNGRDTSTEPDIFIVPTSSPGETPRRNSNLPTITGVTSVTKDKPINSVIHPTQIKYQVIEKSVEQKTDEEDDCSTFAAHVKMRMRKFSPSQKTIAQKLIYDIMFMADTQQLQMNSSIVSPLSHHLMPHTMIPIGPVAIPHGSTWTTMMPTVSVTSEAPVNMTTVSMASSLPATKAPSLKRSNNGAIKTTKPVENSSLL